MKVFELIALLQELPKGREVIIAKDGEGNSFSPLSDWSIGMYVAESTWSGAIISEDDAKDQDRRYKENAVVLWPVN